MKNNLTIGYITQNDSEWLLLSLESIEHIADEIIIIDGGSDRTHVERLDKFIDGKEKYKIVHNPYPGNNGLQYAQILKHATKDWILVLDSDEVMGDNAHLIKEYLTDEAKCYRIRMNHLIGDMAHIDATHAGTPKVDPEWQHYSPIRLYKRKEGIFYLPNEHTALIGYTEEQVGMIDDVIIWHYGKCRDMMDLKNKYLMNLERSKIHPPGFLNWWYTAHLTSQYPVKKIDSSDHPSVVKREFKL